MDTKKAITEILKSIPKGQLLPHKALVLEVMHVMHRRHGSAPQEDQIVQAISQGVQDGLLLYLQGRLGGVCINGSYKPATITPTAKVTEGNCKQCGNKNDIGIRKCWSCEVSNPC